MAIVTTPLGFQKPDGNDPVRNGDNVIAANGAKAEELHHDARGRLTVIEAKNLEQDTAIADTKTYTDTQDEAYRATDRALWRAEDDGHQAAAEAAAKTYTDAQVSTDRGRLATIESKNTEQDGRLSAAESAATTLTTRVTDTETKNGEQDGRLTATENAATALTTRVTGTEAKNLAQDITDVNNKNAAKAYTDATAAVLDAKISTSHVALDTDGTPFILYGSTTVKVLQDSDGTPYYEAA